MIFLTKKHIRIILITACIYSMVKTINKHGKEITTLKQEIEELKLKGE